MIPAHERVHASPPRQVVPGPGLPAEVDLLPSNNNLDLAESDGRLYLAFRTGLVHFATRLTRIYVLASCDGGRTWSHELTLDRGRDLREPRLLSWGGRLFLYFFEAGTNPLKFEPGRVFAMERSHAGTWVDPVPITGEGYVVWRTKVVDGRPFMIRYRGGENIYRPGRAQLEIELLTTADGYDWTAADPEHRVVYSGGGSEADFAFTPDGAVVSVIRNEAGDASGFGSLICTAPPESPGDWHCTPDPRKYDSPLVFDQDGEIYLLARRQVGNGGRYDLGLSFLPHTVRLLLNEAVYWVTPKRTSLWQIDPDERRVNWVLDLSSRGDTAFPAVVRLDPRRLLVFNYSSPVDGWDKPWVLGQVTPTRIYSTTLTFA